MHAVDESPVSRCEVRALTAGLTRRSRTPARTRVRSVGTWHALSVGLLNGVNVSDSGLRGWFHTGTNRASRARWCPPGRRCESNRITQTQASSTHACFVLAYGVASVILSCPLALTKHRPACVFRVRVCVRCAIRRVVNMVREKKRTLFYLFF